MQKQTERKKVKLNKSALVTNVKRAIRIQYEILKADNSKKRVFIKNSLTLDNLYTTAPLSHNKILRQC